MFGFAVEGFKALLGEVYSPEQISALTDSSNVVGVILENHDTYVSAEHFIKMAIKANCSIIVFDIINDKNGFMTYGLGDIFAKHYPNYAELKDTYESRIAFARTSASYAQIEQLKQDLQLVSNSIKCGGET